MKRNLPSRLLAVCMIVCSFAQISQAQTFCNLPCPDPNETAPDEVEAGAFDLSTLFVIEGGEIPDGVVGSPYCVNITLKVPGTITNITGVPFVTEADIDSVVLNPSGFILPEGLSFTCVESCRVPGGTVQCFQIAGVPTQPLLNDTIRGDFSLYLRSLLGPLPVQQADSITLAVVNIESNPLPVELTSFEAHPASEGNVIAWSTSSEWNNQGFVVQHASPDLHFTDLTFVESRSVGNEISRYQWMDKENTAQERSYYRLKQIDWDGSETYSEMIEVRRARSHHFQIFPNPAADVVHITWPTPRAGVQAPIAIAIRNVQGQIMVTYTEADAMGQIGLDVSTLPRGVYVMEVSAEEKSEHLRFVKR
ncbi:MAG: T9SS type A sorting domain-containing protein [Saprospiraceae bacterium]|nr:T9SS type A sorting domain-containing protein [Saprospiraceae bacterium]